MLKKFLHDIRTRVDYRRSLIFGVAANAQRTESGRNVLVINIPLAIHRLQIAFEIAVECEWNFMCAYDIFEFHLFAWRRIQNTLGRVDLAIWNVVFETVGFSKTVEAVGAYMRLPVVRNTSAYESGK